MKKSLAVVLPWLLPALSAAAQKPPPVPSPEPAYSLQIHRLSGAPVIDGKLDDPVWQEGNLLRDFIQLEPDHGQPATQRTEARLGYDARNLYFGIRCYDTEPGKVVSGSMRVDADLSIDDHIRIVLDTFHDGRNGYMFSVNPIGAKTDALVRNEGEEINVDWNGLWEAATSRDAAGWTAEIAIPFKTLRFPRADPQTWGFNLRRFLPRRQEASFWKPLQLHPGPAAGTAGYEISEFGEIRGLSGLGTGGRYQLTPYAIARGEQGYHADARREGDAGGDLQINLTSGLAADLTVRTDFAEAEADQQQINLERFRLFYPERRQFFLEGASLFYFGDRPEPLFDVPEKFYFFFSRQIGLAEDGRVVVPILAGAKLAGREGDTSIGLLSMSTEAASYVDAAGTVVDEPRTNYTVLRLKQRLFGNSTVGLIGLNKDPQGGDSNRGAGFDWDFALGNRWYTAGYAAGTDTPGLDGRNHAYSADLIYRGQVLRARHRYTNIGENFNPEMGFLTRSDIIKNHSDLIATFRLDDNPLGLRRFSLVFDTNHITDHRGNLQTQLTLYELGTTRLSSAGLALIYYDELENLDAPLPVEGKAVIPAGHYRFRSLFTGITSGYSRRAGFTFWYHSGGYYGGDRLRTLLALVLRPVDGLVITPTLDRVRVDAPWGRFTTQIAETAVDYSLSPTLLARLTLQRRQGDNYRANFMIDWIYRPGSHLFLVYDDIGDLDEQRRSSGFSPLSPGRTITLKASRRVDF